MKIGIVAGEASGDLLGAKLMQCLQTHQEQLQFEGIGGPAMIAQGCQSLFDIERLSVMGFIEPLKRLPDLIKLRRDLIDHFSKNPPDIFIGIDAPDFNFGVERKLRAQGVPVIHYVSPSVWAWRQYRIKKIAKSINLMLTLLPFEKDFYQQHQVPAHYVGHPLAQQIALEPDTLSARRALCVDENAQYVALLPGSRRQEINYLSEPFLKAAQILFHERPALRFLTSHVNEQRYQEFYEYHQAIAPELPIQFFTQRSHDVMAAADVVVVTSGTATLETMLHKKPMVITYKMSKLTYLIAKHIVKSRYVGLPNLLADELLVPELIQDNATPEQIAANVKTYLDENDKVQYLQDKFKTLHQSLYGADSATLAQAVFSVQQEGSKI